MRCFGREQKQLDDRSNIAVRCGALTLRAGVGMAPSFMTSKPCQSYSPSAVQPATKAGQGSAADEMENQTPPSPAASSHAK